MTEHHRSSEWAKVRSIMRPRIAAALPLPCIDCGRPIMPGDKWQLGHRVPVVEAKRRGWTTTQINQPANLGPTHAKAPGQRACNQIAGGKLGAKISNHKKQAERRMPSW